MAISVESDSTDQAVWVVKILFNNFSDYSQVEPSKDSVPADAVEAVAAAADVPAVALREPVTY